MVNRQQKNGLLASLCLCCCCGIIFGIVGLVYYEDSFLDIKHQCQLYYLYNTLCQYACGTICHRRLQIENDTDIDTDSSSSSSHTHCYTRYCWGYRYVYEWKTMDWMYHPYKIEDGFVKNTEMDQNKLYGYIPSVFVNQTKETEEKLKVLLEYINDENHNILLSDDEIMNIDLNKYIMDSRDIGELFVGTESTAISSTFKPIIMRTTNEMNEFGNTTVNRYNAGWCDWKRPAYYTYGSCSSWPYQWYSYGDTETCYTNDACSSFSTLSPYTNWDLAKGFGFAAVACFALFLFILLYWFLAWCYDKICGRTDYDRIFEPETKTYTKTSMSPLKDDDYAGTMYDDFGNETMALNQEQVIVPPVNPDVMVINEAMPFNQEMIINQPMGFNQEVIVNEQMPFIPMNNEMIVDEEIGINEREILQEMEGGQGGIDIIDDDYTMR